MEQKETNPKRDPQTRQRIGLRVQALRKLAGLTQDQLAEQSGLGRTHIVRLEQGKYDVKIDTLQAVAQALGMTVDIVDPRLRDLAPMKVLTDKNNETT